MATLTINRSRDLLALENLISPLGRNEQSQFHAVWLRDNCRCDACGEPAVGRRKLKLSSLDIDITIQQATLLQSDQGDLVDIEWSDGHQWSFTLKWLEENRYDNAARARRAFQPTIWDSVFLHSPPQFDFSSVCAGDAQLFEFLQMVRDYGVAFIANAPLDPSTMEPFARRFGLPQESNFGRIQDIKFDPDKRSIANDVHELKPHTDEPYRASPPGIVMFHCIETDITGAGSSTFMDGFAVAETLRQEDPDGFQALTRNPQGFRRHFADDVDLIAEFAPISIDEFGNICGVRINDRVAAPTCIDPEQVPVYYRGMQRFLQLSEQEERMMKKTLRPGDIAIFDNHRVLHGRTKLTFSGSRWLQWVQIERGDFYSSLRILADRLGYSRSATPLLRGAFN